MQSQTDKISQLEAKLSHGNAQSLQEEIDHLKQIIESKEQSSAELG